MTWKNWLYPGKMIVINIFLALAQGSDRCGNAISNEFNCPADLTFQHNPYSNTDHDSMQMPVLYKVLVDTRYPLVMSK